MLVVVVVRMGLVVALTVVVTVRERQRQQRATASREPCLALFFAHKTKMVRIFLGVVLIPTTQHYDTTIYSKLGREVMHKKNLIT